VLHRNFIRERFIMCLILLCVCTPLYASPSLANFMQKVWEKNPTILAAESALRVAEARRLAANQPIYNPELDVELERAGVNTLGIGISQSVDWGNKRSAATSKAEADVQLAQAELAMQRQTSAAEILNALANRQATHQLQNLAQQRVGLMQEFVDNTEKRQQAGDIGLQDVMLARVALSEAKMQLANYAAQQAENEAKLQAASGLFTRDWPALTQEPPALTQTIKLDTFQEQLPTLNALRAKLSAARFNVNLSRATQKADPNFGLRGGMEGNEVLIGLSFSMPLYVRNRFGAEVEVANQEVLQIDQLLLSAIHRAQVHLNGSYRRYQLTYAAWQAWKKTGLNTLNEQLKLIQIIWKLGEMSTADYLVQAKQNVDAQETAVGLSTQMWQSWIEWLSASGQIESWLTSN